MQDFLADARLSVRLFFGDNLLACNIYSSINATPAMKLFWRLHLMLG